MQRFFGGAEDQWATNMRVHVHNDSSGELQFITFTAWRTISSHLSKPPEEKVSPLTGTPRLAINFNRSLNKHDALGMLGQHTFHGLTTNAEPSFPQIFSR